jgi:hypothetical protein
MLLKQFRVLLAKLGLSGVFGDYRRSYLKKAESENETRGKKVAFWRGSRCQKTPGIRRVSGDA